MSTVAITGGAGGEGAGNPVLVAGTVGSVGGGGGGGGGVAIFFSGMSTLTNSSTLTGGAGGKGGDAAMWFNDQSIGAVSGGALPNNDGGRGGDGGAGAAAVLFAGDGTLINSGTIQGGDGGQAGAAGNPSASRPNDQPPRPPPTGGRGGDGGDGGSGIVVLGQATITTSGTITGGKGNDGADGTTGGVPAPPNGVGDGGKGGDGGNGGQGGTGIQAGAQSTINVTAGSVTGGNGGAEGEGGAGGQGSAGRTNGFSGLDGAAGSGGHGILAGAGSQVTVGTATITGGNYGGSGGNGGHGVSLAGGSVLTNNGGTIIGGNGVGIGVVLGSAGSGVYVNGDGTRIITSGTIGPGTVDPGFLMSPGVGDAINLNGNNNTVELQKGFAFTGNAQGTKVVANGTNNALALGGSQDFSFDVTQIGPAALFRGFTAFETAATGTGIYTLQGVPTVATPWQLLGGTLSVNSSAQLGAIGDLLTFNGGNLQVTGPTFTDFGGRPITWGPNGGGIDIKEAANTFTVSALTGGPLRVNPVMGAGTVKLMGDSTFTAATVNGVAYGGVDVYSGALLLDGTTSITAPTTTIHGGTLGGNNAAVINGNVINAGTLEPGFGLTVADAGKTMTITGNYTGTGAGTLAINAFLGDNTNSKTDQLIVNNGTMGGSTAIIVDVDPTSPGGDTTGNGIPIVVAAGQTTTDPKAFHLGKDVLGGAKYYLLLRGQEGSQQDVNSWYLCTTSDCLNSGGQGGPGFIPPLGPPPFLPPGQPLYHGGTPMQSLYGTMARQLGLLTLGTFHERNGDQRLADTGGRERGWARLFGEHMEQSHAGTVRPSFDGNFVGLQGGTDLWQFASLPGHRDNVGMFAAYTEGRAHVSGLVIGIPNLFAGSTDFNATSLGAYWSHIAPAAGWYTDAVLMGTLYDGDGRTRHATDVGVEGSGVIASLEGGFTLARFAGLKLEPQAQLVYQYVNLDEAHHNNSAVEHHTPDALHGRIGLRLAADSLPWILRPYLKANVWQDFVGADRTIWGGGADELVIRHRATTLELGGGFTAQIAPNVALWASADWSTDIGGNEQERESVSGTAGLRIVW